MNLLILETDAITLSLEIHKHLNEGWSMVREVTLSPLLKTLNVRMEVHT